MSRWGTVVTAAAFTTSGVGVAGIAVSASLVGSASSIDSIESALGEEGDAMAVVSDVELEEVLGEEESVDERGEGNDSALAARRALRFLHFSRIDSFFFVGDDDVGVVGESSAGCSCKSGSLPSVDRRLCENACASFSIVLLRCVSTLR